MAKPSSLSKVKIYETLDGDNFEIDRQGLINILSIALSNTNFDNDFYIKTNEDVREGIKRGDISSAFDHFVEFGFLEGRRGWRLIVDERFYLSENDDVRQSIKNGQFKNGQEHFDAVGEAEGRLPYRGFSFFNPVKKLSVLSRKP